MDDKSDENYIYYLVAKNLTQSQFAELCNYSDGFIMNIESEKYYQTFSLGTIGKFAQVLDIDIRDFFEPIDE